MTDHNIIATANRLAARMGGRFVLYDKKGPTMTDKVEVTQADLDLFNLLHIDCKLPDDQPYLDRALDLITRHRLASTDPLMGEVREAAEPILRYHETGGHEGDGSDEALARLRALLARIEEPKG